MDETCPYCAEYSRLFVKANGDILMKCPSCELIFLYPYPTTEEMVHRHLSQKYADHPYFVTGEEMAEKGGNPFYHLVIDLLRKYLTKDSKVLDVGAGRGDFLWMANSYFSVSAIEPSPYLANRIKERIVCPVYIGAFEDYYPKQGEEIDAVIFLDIIEHAANPYCLVEKAYGILRPGGILFISTIDSESIMFRLGPLFWWLSNTFATANYILTRIFCYQHNWYFNKKVLHDLLIKNSFSILEQKGFEFPLGRLQEKKIILIALKIIYFIQKLLKVNTEQYVLAKKLS